METPIKAMYQAAKVDIPAEGDYLARIAGHLNTALETLDHQSAYAGEPPLMTSMLRVGGDVYDVLRLAVRSLDNCSAALIATADDYRKTDGQAQTDYENLGQQLKDKELPHHSAPELQNPDPETPGFDNELPPIGPYPPGSTVHVDPSEDPRTPGQDQQDREANEPSSPDVPELEF